MADEKKAQLAASIYQALTAQLKEIGIRSFEGKQDEDGDYVIEFKYTGEDLPMTIYLIVDVDRQLLRSISPLPVRFKEEQMNDAAQAICAINNRIVNGRFDLNVVKGNVSFTLCTSFMESLIADRVFTYVVGVTINTVDDYNDKLFMMSKGMLELPALLEELHY
jgi:hypothetical protein